jgi:fumarate reductase subunit C
MAEQMYLDVRQAARGEAYLDFLQLITGVALILFMWSHMILVASINLGSGVMNAIAMFLERYYLAQLGGPLIAFLFLLHFVLTARKLPFRSQEQVSIWRHSLRLHHLDTWLWVVQAATAMLILIMGAVHMWVVLTDLPITAAKSAARIQGGWWLAFYLILLPLVELHLAIGFYRIGVKWGWITRSNRGFFQGVEKKLSLSFVILGLISLFTFYFIIKAVAA